MYVDQKILVVCKTLNYEGLESVLKCDFEYGANVQFMGNSVSVIEKDHDYEVHVRDERDLNVLVENIGQGNHIRLPPLSFINNERHHIIELHQV